MKETTRAVLALFFLGSGRMAAQPTAEAKVRIDLAKGDLVVSLVPSLGGRVVALRAGDGPNLLSWDERRESSPVPLPALETPFEDWNGRVIWVGPQSAWWADQDQAPARRAAKAGWPPDPFHETAL